jgi:hypothetical protein
MATFLHNIVNIEQAPKIPKDQIRMNVNVNIDKLKIFLLILFNSKFLLLIL